MQYRHPKRRADVIREKIVQLLNDWKFLSQSMVQFSSNEIVMLDVWCRLRVERVYQDLDIKSDLLVTLQFPVDTKHLYNICTMLDQRRRRWADVVQMLYRFFVLAGLALDKDLTQWFCNVRPTSANITKTYFQRLGFAGWEALLIMKWNEMNRALGHLCAHIG